MKIRIGQEFMKISQCFVPLRDQPEVILILTIIGKPQRKLKAQFNGSVYYNASGDRNLLMALILLRTHTIVVMHNYAL